MDDYLAELEFSPVNAFDWGEELTWGETKIVLSDLLKKVECGDSCSNSCGDSSTLPCIVKAEDSFFGEENEDSIDAGVVYCFIGIQQKEMIEAIPEECLANLPDNQKCCIPVDIDAPVRRLKQRTEIHSYNTVAELVVHRPMPRFVKVNQTIRLPSSNTRIESGGVLELLEYPVWQRKNAFLLCCIQNDNSRILLPLDFNGDFTVLPDETDYVNLKELLDTFDQFPLRIQFKRFKGMPFLSGLSSKVIHNESFVLMKRFTQKYAICAPICCLSIDMIEAFTSKHNFTEVALFPLVACDPVVKEISFSKAVNDERLTGYFNRIMDVLRKIGFNPALLSRWNAISPYEDRVRIQSYTSSLEKPALPTQKKIKPEVKEPEPNVLPLPAKGKAPPIQTFVYRDLQEEAVENTAEYNVGDKTDKPSVPARSISLSGSGVMAEIYQDAQSIPLPEHSRRRKSRGLKKKVAGLFRSKSKADITSPEEFYDEVLAIRFDKPLNTVPPLKHEAEIIDCNEEEDIYTIPIFDERPEAEESVVNNQINSSSAGSSSNFRSLDEIPEDLSTLSVVEVSKLLRFNALSDLTMKFMENLIDGAMFLSLTEEILLEEPFKLNKFQMLKVKKIQAGYKPKL
ncbi:uncharacterized protein LOC141898423 [Tubulanus polymorphus]|uniref:uncharacterized protein LOC141898423 n=1 Tax=Tubulanus polymorphus TaxID=672921 RepID=UPI003DA1DC9E